MSDDNVVDLSEYKQKKEDEMLDGTRWVWAEPDMNDPDHKHFLDELEAVYRDGVSGLSDEEINKLLYLSIEGTGEDGLSEDDAVRILKWSEKVILDYNILSLAVNGKVALSWDHKNDDLFVMARDG